MDKIPILLFEYLPINNPKKVNDAAHILKIAPDRIKLLVIACNPSPVEKLSKLTERDTNSILNKFISKKFSSLFNNSKSISIPIIINIIPNKKLTFMFKNVVILVPSIVPNKGIKKCIIPTNNDKNNVFFLDIPNVPKLSEIENVSIDKDTPIINSEIIIDTQSP